MNSVYQSAEDQNASERVKPVPRHSAFASADTVVVLLHLLFEAVKHETSIRRMGLRGRLEYSRFDHGREADRPVVSIEAYGLNDLVRLAVFCGL
jgi:hypothetical protein